MFYKRNMRVVDTIVQDKHPPKKNPTTNNWNSIESALFIWKKDWYLKYN